MGRDRARKLRTNELLVMTSDEPSAAIDGWDGTAVALPAESLVGRAAQRVRGKQQQPVGVIGVPVTPGATPRRHAAAGPTLPVRHDMAQDDTPPEEKVEKRPKRPDPKKLFAPWEAGHGRAWVCWDLLRQDRYGFGQTVELFDGCEVQGHWGLFKAGEDDFVPVRQYRVGDVPGLPARATDLLRKMTGEDCEPAEALSNGALNSVAEVGAGEPQTDLRDKLLIGSGRTRDRAPRKEAEEPEGGDDGPDDVRTLSVDYDDHGERHKRWRAVAREATSVRFPDWPFDDQHSQVMHLVKHWDRHAEDGLAWLDKWLADRKVSPSERTGIEMKCLVTTIHVAGTYDHLNLGALASMETIGRRIAQIVEAYSGDASQPRWAGVHLYQGTTDIMAAIDPNLRAGVARKRKEELEVANLANKVHSGKFADVGEALPSPPVGAGDGPAWARDKRKAKPKKTPLVAPGGPGK